ncbi:putative ubiquitin specific protease, papain-like cysteine peptidase superfamily [Septoria linicola]|nr:putative ubiquitin specific protease, papain-like cysteine peptidase superfamily [Septoria linicola]
MARRGAKRSASRELSSSRAGKKPSPSGAKSRSKSPSPGPSRPSTGGVAASSGPAPRPAKSNGLLFLTPPKTRRVQPDSDLPGAINQFPDVKFPKSKGFENRAVDCYRSAVLAALFHVPGFYRYMGMLHRDCHLKGAQCLLCRLQDLCYNYYAAEDPKKAGGVAKAPPRLYKKFHEAVELNLPEFYNELKQNIQVNAQSDPREFLEYLLREQIRPKQSPADSISYEQMFELETKQSWTCADCGVTRTNPSEETMHAGFYVRLQVPDARNGRSLRLFMEQSELFSANVERRCDTAQCIIAERAFGRDGPVRRVTTTIVRAPEVLFVGLQRIDPNFLVKDFTRVNYPEVLDLSPWVESTEIAGDLNYRLDAVVAHKGDSIDSGHYIAAVRKHYEDGFEIVDDDNLVGPTQDGSFRELQRPQSFSEEAQAMILMYSKL